MTKADDRDKAVDSLLGSTLQSSTSSVGRDVCPDAEILAAWTEGALTPAEAADVEAHLATCASCQEVLAVFARTEQLPAATESLWRRWRLQWAVPIAAAATVVALYVAAPDDRQTPPVQARRVVPPAAPAAEAPAPGSAVAAIPLSPPAEKREGFARQDAVGTEPGLEKETRAVEEDRLQAAARAPESALRDESAASQPRRADSPAAAASSPAQNQVLGELSQQNAGGGRGRAATPIDVISPDPLVRWRIVVPGRLERSTDGGQTWAPVPLPDGLNAVAVRAPGAMTAIVTASDGRQFQTEDQGKTWTQLTN